MCLGFLFLFRLMWKEYRCNKKSIRLPQVSRVNASIFTSSKCLLLHPLLPKIWKPNSIVRWSGSSSSTIVRQRGWIQRMLWYNRHVSESIFEVSLDTNRTAAGLNNQIQNFQESSMPQTPHLTRYVVIYWLPPYVWQVVNLAKTTVAFGHKLQRRWNKRGIEAASTILRREKSLDSFLSKSPHSHNTNQRRQFNKRFQRVSPRRLLGKAAWVVNNS